MATATLAVSASRKMTDGTVRRMLARALRAPLAVKIVGANVFITVTTLATAGLMHAPLLADTRTVVLLMIAAGTGQLVNAALVNVALRPLRSVEEVASRIRFGEYSARVTDAPLADREIRQLGTTLNALVDGLLRERVRIRHLAAEVIRRQDEERIRVSRQLHESTAQIMAGIVLQLSALEQSVHEGDLAPRLRALREAATTVLDELRTVSQALHPRALEELGLGAALRAIAHSVPASTGLDVSVVIRGHDPIPQRVASALYHVAQEAVENGLRHAGAMSVDIRLDIDASYVTLEIEDNGRGFDARSARLGLATLGLFAMRERIALVDGVLEIDSAPGRGSSIRARVPLNQAV